MASSYDPEEQQQDVELYHVDWDRAHSEAFGDTFDVDMLNRNAQNIDAEQMLIENEDLDDRLKEQESMYLER